MKAFDAITNIKFKTPIEIFNYFTSHKIIFKVDPETKDRLYAIKPDSGRSYTFLVKEDKNKNLYLVKE